MFLHDGVRESRSTTRNPEIGRYLRPHRTNLLRALIKSLRYLMRGYIVGMMCE